MPTCRECNNDVDELVAVRVEGKRKKMCQDCADRAKESELVGQESEGVIQEMMGFRGRR
jgi:hypothetical protein